MFLQGVPTLVYMFWTLGQLIEFYGVIIEQFEIQAVSGPRDTYIDRKSFSILVVMLL